MMKEHRVCLGQFLETHNPVGSVLFTYIICIFKAGIRESRQFQHAGLPCNARVVPNCL